MVIRTTSKDPLGQALGSYIGHQTQGSFDPEFKSKLEKLAPEWFLDSAAENKKQLLEMAKQGEPKPQYSNTGLALDSYIRSYSGSYDSDFKNRIEKLAPQWFIDTVAEKKIKLLDIAKSGATRPHGRHPLGATLCRYTSPSQLCYDPTFKNKIQKLAPEWFVKSSNENKKQLLEMAKNGKPKPHYKNHPLGGVFNNYINGRCYDSAFRRKIKKLAPNWLIKGKRKRKQNQVARYCEVGRDASTP